MGLVKINAMYLTTAANFFWTFQMLEAWFELSRVNLPIEIIRRETTISSS